MDKYTYAGNNSTRAIVMDNPNFCFCKLEICDRDSMFALFEEEKTDVVIEFAVGSLVDGSIKDPGIFPQANIIGTAIMMEACRAFGKENNLMSLKYLIIDVDGTLTDGGIYYDNNGNELKKFCTKDGTGFVIARTTGIKLIVMTGRECGATTRRMKELKVDYVFQGINDKVEILKKWIEENGIKRDELGYIGDDINDLSSMKLCGYIGCPADACEEVKAISNYISTVKGGAGAVRDVIEHYLKEQGIWNEMVNKCFGNAGM